MLDATGNNGTAAPDDVADEGDEGDEGEDPKALNVFDLLSSPIEAESWMSAEFSADVLSAANARNNRQWRKKSANNNNARAISCEARTSF
jgi:hypothetical protein